MDTVAITSDLFHFELKVVVITKFVLHREKSTTTYTNIVRINICGILKAIDLFCGGGMEKSSISCLDRTSSIEREPRTINIEFARVSKILGVLFVHINSHVMICCVLV